MARSFGDTHHFDDFSSSSDGIHSAHVLDETYTRYQVSYSARGKYKAAKCAKLKAASMCPADFGSINPINFTQNRDE